MLEYEDSDEPVERPTIRDRLRSLFHSHRFHIGVIGLVVFDCLIILAELLCDLEIIYKKEEHEELEIIPHVLHFTSVAILSIFLVELILKIFVFRLELLRHKLEIFDALIIIVSFILDMAFLDDEDAKTFTGLFVILRLWRVTRIINGIVISAKKEAETKVEKEKEKRVKVEEELNEIKEEVKRLKDENEQMREKLQKHGIE